MLAGIVRHRGNEWFVENVASAFSAPVHVTTAWRVTGARRRAMYGPAPELVEGLAVTYPTGGPAWQAHEHGNYLVLETEERGTQTEMPYPCPRVRRGTETRYHNGAWQKYSQRAGWIAA